MKIQKNDEYKEIAIKGQRDSSTAIGNCIWQSVRELFAAVSSRARDY